MADYYKRLNIKKDASTAEIKKAFRKKAMKVHPDHGGTHTSMRKLNKMYKTLTNPKQRKRYNQTLDGKRIKIVPINKPPRPEHYSSPARENIWEEHIHHTRGTKRTTRPRPEKLKEEDLNIVWGTEGPPGREIAKPGRPSFGRVDTQILQEAQELLATIKKKKPLMGSKIDIAYLQLGQIINLLKGGKR